jgi:hypothetical protein
MEPPLDERESAWDRWVRPAMATMAQVLRVSAGPSFLVGAVTALLLHACEGNAPVVGGPADAGPCGLSCSPAERCVPVTDASVPRWGCERASRPKDECGVEDEGRDR